jgi:hypothetical protein
MSTLTLLERQVVEMLLAGPDEVLAILRHQAEAVKVSSRKMTGVGFFTAFEVSSDAGRVPGRLTFKLSDVHGTATDVKHGLGFLLSVTDGTLAMLEGYTYDEPWPPRVRGLALKYWDGDNRDMNSVKKIIREK